MPVDWRRPIARFRQAARGGQHVGAGVLIAGDHVVTCAHVVEDVLKGSVAQPGRDAALQVDLPFAGVFDVGAKVVAWFPVIPELERRSDSRPSDLAVLELDRSDLVESIEPCLIASTDPKENTAFSCWGFPIGFPNGADSQGKLRGTDAGGWIDAVANAPFGHFIEPGFSGAPVFKDQVPEYGAGEFLGLCVTAASGDKRVARLIPPGHLAEAVRTVVSPYRWLEHFSQRDVAYFFGRDGLTEDLWKTLRKRQFLILAGPAGSGKSSLLQAGLMTKARREGMSVLVMRPLGNASAELARLFGLSTSVKLDIDGFVGAIKALVEPNGLLLAIDQAEELVRDTNRQQVAAFLQLLADLRSTFGVQLLIALAARSDELPALLAAQPPRPRLLEQNLHYIDELGREELQLAIELPAKRMRVGFESGLVLRIVNDVLFEPRVPLPILQLCLSRLWEGRKGATLTEQAYLDMGGLTGALANQARSILEEVRAGFEKTPGFPREIMEFAPGVKPSSPFPFFLGKAVPEKQPALSLSEAVEQIYSRVLLQLVEVSDRGEDRRSRVRLSSFSRWERLIVQSLARGRLVVISRDSTSDQEMAELAHDSLLTKWDKLGDWIEVRRDHLRLRGQLQREAAYWDKRGRQPIYRWSNERALDTSEMMEALSYRPSEVEAAFLGPVDRSNMLSLLKEPETTHEERATIGDRLALLGDERKGTGALDGLPEIVWCPVPGGRIVLDGDASEVDIEPFEMAKYPVTYKQYRLFLEDEDGYYHKEWWSGLTERYYEEPGRQIPPIGNHPAVNVDWMEAVAYARWLSRKLGLTTRLPTEWEWQQAATQGKADFEYPWGPSWDPSRANTYENKLNRTVAVGLYPQGMVADVPLDLAGNTWEWCLNQFYQLAPPSETVYGGLELRAIRGGAGSSPSKYARTHFRNRYRPDYRFDALGFRLVRTSPPK